MIVRLLLLFCDEKEVWEFQKFEIASSGVLYRGPSIKYVRKISQKTNISNAGFRKVLRTYLMDCL